MSITAQQALLQLLANQGSRGARGNRFDSGVAKARLQDLLDQEERDKLRASFQPDENVEESLYGVGGARRKKRMELEAANLQHSNQLEDAARLRQQQQALQDMQFQKQQGSLRSSLSPAPRPQDGQSAGASRKVPYVDPTAEAGIINAQFPGRKTKGGLDITNPDHVAIARKKVEEAMKSGKGIDAKELQASIQSEIQAGNLKELQQGAKVLGLKAKMKQDYKALNETAKEAKRNGVPLTGAMKTAHQKKIDAALDVGSFLDVVDRTADEKFFNTFNQAELMALRKADRLGVSTDVQKSKLERFKRFQITVDNLFAKYVKSISGAQVAEPEFQRLKKSFINMDLGPAEFKATLEGLKAGVELDRLNSTLALDADGDYDKLRQLKANDPKFQQLFESFDALKNMASNLDKREQAVPRSESDRIRLLEALERKRQEA